MQKAFCLVILLLVLAQPVLAQEIPDYKEKYANDFANVFTAEQAAELRALFSDVETNTTAEVTVLTVETVSPMSTSQYAQEVFDKWEIGKAANDNGLLILYAKQEDKIWVATGYGLEGILPDSKIGRILDETFVPARANNDSAGGIVLAAREYAAVINANAEEVRAGREAPGFNIFFFLPILFPLLFIGFFAFIAYDSARPKCSCGGRADVIKTEVKKEKKKGPLGMMVTSYYTLVTYKCKKCGKTWTKRTEGRYRKSGAFLVAAGAGRRGSHGRGFGGGFGGGRAGGGGAGR